MNEGSHRPLYREDLYPINCHDMKFDLDDYEMDEDYFEAAVKRLKKHASQGQLF